MVVAATTAIAQGGSAWPRTIEGPEGTVVIYQPQVDRFDGDELESRAAIAVTPAGPARPSTPDREWAARQRGQQRAQTYRSAPPARAVPPAPKPIRR